MSSSSPDQATSFDAESATWFTVEIEPHQPALRSWLKARFPWLRDVENIAQEAAIRLWWRRKRSDRLPLRHPKAVLFAIAHNLAIDEVRRNAVISFDSVAEIPELSVLEDKADVVETVSARQELEFLADALRELPARCRQVVTLAKIYGKTEREVSEIMGISENTVRTQVVRGMGRCTEYLRRHGVNRGKA